MNKIKSTKGITLVALVVTIVVLIILAGVSINLVLGENGIIQKSKEAKTETAYKSAEEKVKLAIMGTRADDGEMTLEELKTEVTKYKGSVTGDTFPVEVQMDGHTFTVDANGVISDKGTGGGNTPSGEEISKSESYVGYYADIDGDKNVDGIIYADLAVGGSGTWNNNSSSSYEYTKVTEGLKSYYISSENGTGFGTWEKPVVTAKEGTTGKDRFYVMALEDFNPGTSYYWYNSASDKLDNIVDITTNDFGQGKTNTTTMIAEWNKGENGKYGAQNAQDMWGVIQKDDNAGKSWDLSKWFVPSKAEWASFAEELGINRTNYENFGLRGFYYWSSSQYDFGFAWCALFSEGYMTAESGTMVAYSGFVRLSATF